MLEASPIVRKLTWGPLAFRRLSLLLLFINWVILNLEITIFVLNPQGHNNRHRQPCTLLDQYYIRKFLLNMLTAAVMYYKMQTDILDVPTDGWLQIIFVIENTLSRLCADGRFGDLRNDKGISLGKPAYSCGHTNVYRENLYNLSAKKKNIEKTSIKWLPWTVLEETA